MSSLGSDSNTHTASPPCWKGVQELWREEADRCRFLDVATACDTVWADGLFYKLTILNFPSYLATTISSYLYGRKFEASFQLATSTCGMRDGVAQGGNNFPRTFQSVCQRHAYAIPPRRAGSLRGRHGIHCHVPLSSAAPQPPGGVSQRSKAVSDRMEDGYQRLEEHRDVLR